MLKAFLQRQAFNYLAKDFSLKNPGPLKEWAADLLGIKSDGLGKPYRQSIWAYRCLQQWQRVAQVPLLLKDDEGETIAMSPLRTLLDQPAPQVTLGMLIEALTLSFGRHGEYFLLKEDGFKTEGMPLYLQPVSPLSVCLRPGDVVGDVVVTWSIRKKSGKYIRIPAEGVIHDYFIDPTRPHRGMSPMIPAMASMESDWFGRNHNKHQMKQHGRVSGLVSMKEDTDPEKLATFAKLWREKYEGGKNAGKTAFLGGAAEYQQLSLSAKDMDWMNGMDITREEICAAFGISTIVAGGLKGATFSNYDQAMKAAWDEVLMPLGRRIAEKFTMELVQPVEPDQHVEFDFINTIRILQEDVTKKAERYVLLVTQGKISPKQAAMMLNMDIGEPDPAHDVVWVSANEMPASMALDEPESAQSSESKGIFSDFAKELKQFASKEGKTVDVEPILGQKCCPEPHTDLTAAKESSEPQRMLVHKNLRQIRMYELKMEKTLKRYFFEQRKSVLERLADSEPPLTKDMGGVVKAIDDAWIFNLLAGKDWNAALEKRMRPLITSVAQLGARQIIREAGVRLEPIIVDEYVKSQMVLLKKVNDTTAEALIAAANDVVSSTLEGGIPIEQLVDNMKGAFKGVYNNTESRRRLIARTETTRAMNGGRFEQMQSMGAPFKQWITILDGNERAEPGANHRILDGMTIALDEEFAPNLRFPGDPEAPIQQTANCRCSIIPKFNMDDEG